MSLQTKVDYALDSKEPFVADEQASPRTTTSTFIARLEKTRALSLPRFNEEGDVTGISFWLDGKIMKGSSLGHGFSWNKLQDRGLDYKPGRDNRLLLQTKEKTEKVIEKWKENQALEVQQSKIKQIKKPDQLIKKNTDETNQSAAAQRVTAHEPAKIPPIENKFAETVETTNIIVDQPAAHTNRFVKPNTEDKSDVSMARAKPQVEENILQTLAEKVQLKTTEISSPEVETQKQPKISQTDLSQTDLSFSETVTEIITRDTSAEAEFAVELLNNQLQQHQLQQGKALSQSLLFTESEQIELMPGSNAVSEPSTDIELAAVEEYSMSEDSDSFFSPKPPPQYEDESNKRFWEQEQERINNQIGEQRREFVQTITQQFQQITENQSQINSQAQQHQYEELQQQTQFQTQPDALGSLNEIMFSDSSGSNTQIYQSLNLEFSSNGASKPLTIEAFNTPYTEENLPLTAESEAEETSSIEEISNNQVSQFDEMDSDSEEYGEDCEDEFDQGFAQVMSLF